MCESITWPVMMVACPGRTPSSCTLTTDRLQNSNLSSSSCFLPHRWMAPPKKGSLPKPLPEGFILSDSQKKKWRLGKVIGQGGFGLIYLGTGLFVDHHPGIAVFTVSHCVPASEDVGRPVASDAAFVIKMVLTDPLSATDRVLSFKILC